MYFSMFLCGTRWKKPLGLKWRASSWTITLFVSLSIAVDLLVHSILIPVLPFHLEKLGYSNVSVWTGWLFFFYSAGLVASTIPIALFSERYATRQWPFISGIVIVIGSQIMLMEAQNYPTMCVAQLAQGIGSSLVWVVGLAILSDSAPPTLIGSRLGIAISGLSIGLTIGPPIGGVLYKRFGFRGPFVFSFVAAFLDFAGRLIIIERKDAIKLGYDPAIIPLTCDSETGPETRAAEKNVLSASTHDASRLEFEKKENVTLTPPNPFIDGHELSFLTVVTKLVKSPRALTALFITFIYGLIFSAQESAVPLHLRRVWNLDPRSVGISWIASVIPTLFSSVLAGFWVDKSGTEWPTVICLLLSLPWWIAIIFEYRLAFFIASFALESLFTSGMVSPITVDLATTSRKLDGVGFGHVYGAFNLASGLGSTVGPILGGQMYAHIAKGWMALCLLFVGLLVSCICLSFRFIGDKPLHTRLSIRG